MFVLSSSAKEGGFFQRDAQMAYAQFTVETPSLDGAIYPILGHEEEILPDEL